MQRLSSHVDRSSCAILDLIRRSYHYGMAKYSTSAATIKLAAQLEDEAKVKRVCWHALAAFQLRVGVLRRYLCELLQRQRHNDELAYFGAR